MSFLIVLIIAISLSMDAFSLSLAYGTLDLSRNDIYRLSIIVGLFHFFMPIIGLFVGNLIINYFPININYLVTIIFCFIGIQMIIETFKLDNDVKLFNFFELLLFGFAVSIDSFSVGIGLNAICNNYLLCSFVFSICSFIFTFLGLKLGKKLNMLFGKISTLIGGVILIIIGFIYL